MNTSTLTGIRRRYLVLLGLRWLGPGFLAPLLVLVLLDRGFTLAQAGALLAVYGITTALLELPTGGLADTLGRRNVLAASALLQLVLYGMLLVASSPTWLAVGFAIGGISRALDSGPLDAWFVDRTRAIDPRAGLRRGLSAGGAVSGIALAVGSIAGGLIPALTGGRIDLAISAALGFGVVYLVAILMLMNEPRRFGQGSVGAAFRRVPEVVGDGVRLGARNRSVRLLLGAAAGVGFALFGLELLWQPRFLDLLGGEVSDTGPLGFLLAGAFAMAAVGAALSPWLARRTGGDPRWAAFVGQTLMALMVLALAAAGGVVIAAIAFVAAYFALGITNPLADELLHEQVGEDVRTTMLSVRSMTQQIAGMAAGLTLGAFADARGIPASWIVVAGALALTALLYLRVELPQPDRELRQSATPETAASLSRVRTDPRPRPASSDPP